MAITGVSKVGSPTAASDPEAIDENRDLERWRSVVGYEGLYEVSDHGRVQGMSRTEWCGSRQRRRSGQILAQSLDPAGRPFVSLSREGRSKGLRVHVLEAAAFLGPRPDGQVVRHLDDDRTNNLLANLAYGTKSDNWHDGVRNRRAMRVRQPSCGRGHTRSAPNLTPDDSCLACSRVRTAVANQFGLGRGQTDVKAVADAYFKQIMGEAR